MTVGGVRHMPELSVVMSVFNGGDELYKSIESILVQTFSDFEFIIINDGSFDNTAEILEAYTKKDNRIKVHSQNNKGLSNSLNYAVSIAGSPIIARQDADDTSLPERFEKQIIYLSANPSLSLIGTGFIERSKWDNFSRKHLNKFSPAQCRKNMIKGNFMCHSSIMFRKRVFEEVGGYNKDYCFAEDYKLYFDFLKISDIGVLPEVMVYKNTCDNSISVKNERKQRVCAIKAKYYAIKEGQYNILNFVYVIKSLIGYILPKSIKRIIDKLRYGF